MNMLEDDLQQVVVLGTGAMHAGKNATVLRCGPSARIMNDAHLSDVCCA